MNFKNEIKKILSDVTELDESNFLLEEPPENIKADFACPCFKLAKLLKKNPDSIAREICDKILNKNYDFIYKINTIGAYVNFYLERKIFAREVITHVFNKKDDCLKLNIGENKNIILDYSSPNIAKPFHVGHLRSTVIGNALYNIFKNLGYNSISINHLGDWGTQFGKLIYAYKTWCDKNKINIKDLSELYVKFHEESQKDLNLDNYARDYFLKMQQGDQEALKIWRYFYDLSLVEFKKIYSRLNIDFDFYIGESFYNNKTQKVVQELRDKNLLCESDGAMIVNLEKYKMPPCLILRKDGGSLYATRDIAAVLYRMHEFNFSKCIYITASDQKLHFDQWFKIIELMGHDWAKNLVHVSFGLVSLDSGKLSTRKGHVILMEDLLDQATEKTKKIIQEKNANLENKTQISEIIGIGAIIFNDLYNSRMKDIVFSWEQILNFEGETGPYVLYTYVRTCSILKKAKLVNINQIDFKNLVGDLEIDIIRNINLFQEKILEAAEKYEPYIISRCLIKISQAFNKFYHNNSILSCEDKINKARVGLTYCVNIILRAGLKLLGIKTSDVM